MPFYFIYNLYSLTLFDKSCYNKIVKKIVSTHNYVIMLRIKKLNDYKRTEE